MMNAGLRDSFVLLYFIPRLLAKYGGGGYLHHGTGLELVAHLDLTGTKNADCHGALTPRKLCKSASPVIRIRALLDRELPLAMPPSYFLIDNFSIYSNLLSDLQRFAMDRDIQTVAAATVGRCLLCAHPTCSLNDILCEKETFWILPAIYYVLRYSINNLDIEVDVWKMRISMMTSNDPITCPISRGNLKYSVLKF